MPTSPETQQQFESKEHAYWAQRDELLKLYRGKWVAIVGGQVAAVGEQMNKVAAEAWRKTGVGLMYVNQVGGEDTVLRVRQVTSGHYDRNYMPAYVTPQDILSRCHAASRGTWLSRRARQLDALVKLAQGNAAAKSN